MQIPISQIQDHVHREFGKHLLLLNASEQSVQQLHTLPSNVEVHPGESKIGHNDAVEDEVSPSSSIVEHRRQMQEMNTTRSEVRSIRDALVSIERRIAILETTSQNGIFIWKIDQVYQLKEKAERGPIVSLHSPLFSTSQHVLSQKVTSEWFHPHHT